MERQGRPRRNALVAALAVLAVLAAACSTSEPDPVAEATTEALEEVGVPEIFDDLTPEQAACIEEATADIGSMELLSAPEAFQHRLDGAGEPEAVHTQAQITSQESEGTTNTTHLTISAASLSSAGFAANDDVFIFAWLIGSMSGSTSNLLWSITYDGTILGPSEMRIDPTNASRERSQSAILRVDLGGTIADIDLDFHSTSGTVFVERAMLFVIKAGELGIENTDWFWDDDTTGQTHTTTLSDTNQASITWNPGSVEDWVALGSVFYSVNDVAISTEARIALDRAGQTTVWREEGSDIDEERVYLMWAYLAPVPTGSKTLSLEVRDDGTGTQSVTNQSSLLLFRAAVFTDLFADLNGTESVTDGTDVLVANITDTLSADQNVLILGSGVGDRESTGGSVYMFVSDGDATPLDPTTDTASTIAVAWAVDTSDDLLGQVMSYSAQTSGALDLRLYAAQGSSTHDMLDCKLLVWGMELAVP